MLMRFRHRPAAAAAMALLSGLALVACDQLGTRAERARELADATGKQVSGETIVDGNPSPLTAASTADRALAGTVLAEFNVEAEEAPRFAIGSIIVKPLGVPEPAPEARLAEADLSVIENEYYLLQDVLLETDASSAPPAETLESAPAPPEPTPADEAPPELEVPDMAPALPKIVINPRNIAETRKDVAEAGREMRKIAESEVSPREVLKMRQQEMRKLSDLSLGDVPLDDRDKLREMLNENPDLREKLEEGLAERAELRKLARRAAIDPEALQAQIDSQSVMLDSMQKWGVGGEVSLSRDGLMVIQIGADGASPTQFRGKGTSPDSFMALAGDVACPRNADPATVRADPVLATACIIADLEASGRFEYVEMDFIFQNQFAKRPPSGTPPVTPPGGNGSSGTGRPSPAPPTPVSYEPNDPLWSLQWHFRDRGSDQQRTPGSAGFEGFWKRQKTTGSRSVTVAVVDTGLQLAHPDIAGSPNIVPGWDMVSDPRMGNDGDGRDSDPNDPGDLCDPTKPFAADSFHGTHVAGTIGAASTNNGSGVAGGAWNVKVVPVRALGKCGGRLSDINDAIRWAAGLIPAEGAGGAEVWNQNPADVINLSIGLLGTCPASLQDAINAVTSRGVIVVSAAGNARMSTSFYAPAGCQNVVTVAAGDARGQITPYSNFGPEVMLLAPGGDLTRDDNGDGKPDGVLSTKAASNCYDPVTGETVATCFYAYEQGTSMAAPHVSAALALLKSRDPRASREALIETLRAALDPREPQQCAGRCSQYPGTTPIPGSPDMCARPCGGGLLNLSKVPVAAYSGLDP